MGGKLVRFDLPDVCVLGKTNFSVYPLERSRIDLFKVK